jgi:hypothetical protein
MTGFFFVSGESLNHDPTFKGPLHKRSCTDVICLLLFIAFLVTWAGVGIYGKEQILIQCVTYKIVSVCCAATQTVLTGTLRYGAEVSGGEGKPEDSNVWGSGTVPPD